MLKKLFVIVALVLFLTPVIALADQGDPGWYNQKNNPQVEQYFKNGYNGQGFVWMEAQPPIPVAEAHTFVGLAGNAESWDFSISSTLWWGNWNDYGMAGGEAWVSGLSETTGNASGTHTGIVDWCWIFPIFGEIPNEADSYAFLHLYGPEVKAWSWAKDYGLTSKAGAGAKIEGSYHDLFVGSFSFGLEGGLETSYTEVGIGGYIFQKNHAGETDYPGGTYAEGGNFSELGFSAFNSVYDQGQDYALFGINILPGAQTHLHGIEGEAKVKGSTYVSVDPYGYNRSAYATTQNSAIIDFPNHTGAVNGYGSVSAAAIRGGTFGGGSAGFGYTGTTSGSGNATIDANIYTGGSSTSVHVTGSANAVAE